MAKYMVNWQIKGLVPDKKYLEPGEIVELDTEKAARGLQVGSLSEIKPNAAAEPGTGTPTGAPDGSQDEGVNIQELSKAQLVQYAQEKLGLSLDINKTKANLLAAIEEAANR